MFTLRLQRAKELIEESFHGIIAAMEAPLSSSLDAAKQAHAVRGLSAPSTKFTWMP